MKKTLKAVIGIFFVTILIFSYTLRVMEVNGRFHDAPVKYHNTGDEVAFADNILMDFSMKGYAVIVEKSEILTYDAFLKKYHAEDEYTYVPDKIYDVTVRLKNIDATDSVGINLMDFYIQGGASLASLDPNMYQSANPKLEGATAIALRKNSDMVIHMPYGLWKDHYRSGTWEHLERLNMNFVATLYPVKNVVRLK